MVLVTSESHGADSGLFSTPEFRGVTVNGDVDASFLMEKEHFCQDFVNIAIFLWTMMHVALYLQGQTSYQPQQTGAPGEWMLL